jgi:hypothetical protein
MIRKPLIAVAFLGMVASFLEAIRDIHRLADRACGDGMAGGNCMGFARAYTNNDFAIFAVFAVLMAGLLLLSHFRPMGK